MEYKEGSTRTDVRIGGKRKGKPVRSERASAARKGKGRAAAGSKKKKAGAGGAGGGGGAAASGGAARAARVGADGAVLGVPSEEVAEVIRSWVPVRRFEDVSKVWAEVGPVVRKILLSFDLGNEERAMAYLVALSRHTALRFRAGHRIDDVAELLSDEALATTFGAKVSSIHNAGTRSKELGVLRKIRLLLLPESYAVRKEMVSSRRKVAAPYSGSEIAQHLGVVRQRSNPKAQRLYGAVLLSLSAGLTSRELSSARGSDLIATPWGLVIETVGLPSGGNRGARLVPILAKYEDELSELAKEIGDDLFLGSYKDGTLRDPSSLYGRSSGLPVFKTNRARSTWSRALLENEVSFISLRKAGARVSNESDLNTLAGELEPSMERFVSSVRGGVIPFDQSKHSHLMQYALGQ